MNISISYHILPKSQQFSNNKISFNLDFVYDIPQIVKNNYVKTLTPTKAHIFYYIDRHLLYHPHVQLKNKTIAKAVGCSEISVIRATNQFHRDGFLLKHQTNKYSPNIFQSEYDRHYKNLLLDKYLFTNPRPRTRVHARARGTRHGFFTKTREEKVNEAQKRIILDNLSAPNMKETLQNPTVMAAIITPTIEKIGSLLSFEEKEQFKLIAFTDETVEHVLDYIEPIVTGKQKYRSSIKNKLAWAISIAIAYCNKHSIKPDWVWYYKICDILGIPTNTDSSNQKKKNPQKGMMYTPWKPAKPEPINQQIIKLKNDIELLSEKIQLNKAPSYIITYTQTIVEKKTRELHELEDQYGQTVVATS